MSIELRAMRLVSDIWGSGYFSVLHIQLTISHTKQQVCSGTWNRVYY